jgi:ATP-binding cassette subfamily F protein uup
VLLVSHDRDFLDRTVTVTLGLDGSGKVDIVAGGYADWERKRRPAQPAGKSAASAVERVQRPRPQTKLSYKDQRDLDLLPKRVEELEDAIRDFEIRLADPDLYRRNPQQFEAITRAIADARAERDAAEGRWLELAEKAEALSG